MLVIIYNLFSNFINQMENICILNWIHLDSNYFKFKFFLATLLLRKKNYVNQTPNNIGIKIVKIQI